jgi:hypothetical protein
MKTEAKRVLRNTDNSAAMGCTEDLRGAVLTSTPARRRRQLRAAFCLAILLALPFAGGLSQQSSGGGMNPAQLSNGSPMGSSPLSSLDDYNPVISEKRRHQMNIDRQKSMVADSDRLLKLAAELNDEIAHSNPIALTPTQIHKVAEIEKLAHRIKDKMAMSGFGPSPNGNAPVDLPFRP